jgi:hypothetical protein
MQDRRPVLRWLIFGVFILCLTVLVSACAKPNPLIGKWQGKNETTGKQVYWEFMRDGRLYTDNFAAQKKFRYRVEQPDVLYISFFGKFDADTQQDELVYHFLVEGEKLRLFMGSNEQKLSFVPDS